MRTVSEFIEQVGRSDFTSWTGYTPQVISRAISENLMPSGWYMDVKSLCKDRGMDTPDHLFRWSKKLPDERKKGASV